MASDKLSLDSYVIMRKVFADIAWYREHRLKRFEIAYVAEAHQGDQLSFYLEQTTENEFYIRLTKTAPESNDGVEICRCKVVFADMNE